MQMILHVQFFFVIKRWGFFAVVSIFSVVHSFFQNPNPEKENPPCNAQELEECDAFLEDGASLCRFDGDTLKVTHIVSTANYYRSTSKHFLIWNFTSIIGTKICRLLKSHFSRNIKSQ